MQPRVRNVSPYEIAQLTLNVVDECWSITDQLAAKSGVPDHQPPLSGLNMASSKLVFSAEVIGFYFQHWQMMERQGYRGTPAILKENEDRIGHIQISTFTSMISSFEAMAKLALARRRHPLKLGKGRIYLGKVMAESFTLGLIDCSDNSFWIGALKLRNSIVHNNAVAEETMRIVLGDGYHIEFRSKEMTQSTPRKSVLLQLAAIKAYARWCGAFLAASEPVE